MIALLLAASAAAAQPATSECPIDRAVYRLRGASEFTAGFLRQDRRKVFASDLVLWLKTPSHTYFFSFSSPNGYGGTYIAPDLDPRRTVKMSDEAERDANDALKAVQGEEPLFIPFDAFDSDHGSFGSPPQSGDPAPTLLFARGVGPALWYDWTRLAAGDEKAPQESMPIGLFAFHDCGGPP